MSLRVLCQDRPRTVALVTDSHALLLSHSSTSSESPLSNSYSNIFSARCNVEFTSTASLDLSKYRVLGSGHGTLGLITLDSDVFLCLITRASKAAAPRPGETVLRIDSVDFYCLNRSHYDAVLDFESRSGYSFAVEDDDFGRAAYEGRDVVTENPFVALQKLLSDGSFYYSTDFNLTNRIQDRANEAVAFDIDALDEDFLWNSYMINPLLQFRSGLTERERYALDSARILTSVIRGFAFSLAIPQSISLLPNSRSNMPSTLTVISRLSSRKAGTRFNSRGIDDDGNVANFVETETVLRMPPGLCFSYTQVRGSVPIFWEQAPGLLPGQQKIQITRSAGATQPAFDKHFANLEVDYGAVHVVNLLSELKPGEAEISERFRYHVKQSPLQHSDHRLLRFTDFDFHAETRGDYESANLIRQKLEGSADSFAFFLSEESHERSSREAEKAQDFQNMPKVVLQQEGVFRTNCLDCLDRTNLIQTLISRMAIESLLFQQGGRAPPEFWARHSGLWADNGDNLSKIYAGTGALKSSFTRHGKMSLSGALADARKSATRLYVNNFADKQRQNTIDVLLGTLSGQGAVLLHDPINDAVNEELKRRAVEYTSSRKVRIWTGTFNVNGRSHGASADLSPWLLGHLRHSSESPALVAVGFQEIVELSPQQIMSTDPASRRIWERAVMETLNEYAVQHGNSRYVLLRTGQLVGAALLLFAREDVLNDIKNVEGDVKKTGLSGVAGNKGGCAIRLEYGNTRICFVTAHLAAGFSNYEERNSDYRTISDGLRFQRNRAIDDHDTIIWMGDFNYRVGLSNEEARSYIEAGNLEALYNNDQLHLQMRAGVVFPYYSEGRIRFPPTYKYDNGTDTYDTSEKARIPAWCDRVLWKGSNLHQLRYDTAPLKFSDHRPVYAVFECVISTVNRELENKLRNEIYNKEKGSTANVTASARSDDTEDEESIGYDPIAPGLPPASSDRRKWWLDNGFSARANIKPPAQSTLNPRRTANPFNQQGLPEADWVHVSHKDTRASGSPSPHRLAGKGAERPRPPPSRPVQTGTLIDLEENGKENKTATRPGLPPPPPPSRVVTAAQPTRGDPAKKAPPPVPKKPLSMAGTPKAVSPRRNGGTLDFSQGLSGPGVYKPPPPLPGKKPPAEAGTIRALPQRYGGPSSAASARLDGLRSFSGGPTSGGRGTSTSLSRGSKAQSPGRGRQLKEESPELLSMSRSSLSSRSGLSSSSVPIRGERQMMEQDKRDMLLDEDLGEGMLGWRALSPGD